MNKQNSPVMRLDLREADNQQWNSTKPALFYREVSTARTLAYTPRVELKAPFEEAQEEEEIELNIEVHLPPKRTAQAILHARHVGRAKPVVTFDFVDDDEVMDW